MNLTKMPDKHNDFLTVIKPLDTSQGIGLDSNIMLIKKPSISNIEKSDCEQTTILKQEPSIEKPEKPVVFMNKTVNKSKKYAPTMHLLKSESIIPINNDNSESVDQNVPKQVESYILRMKREVSIKEPQENSKIDEIKCKIERSLSSDTNEQHVCKKESHESDNENYLESVDRNDSNHLENFILRVKRLKKEELPNIELKIEKVEKDIKFPDLSNEIQLGDSTSLHVTKATSSKQKTVDKKNPLDGSTRILKIVEHKRGTFVCGEKGLVMRMNYKKTFVYHTNTDEDIVELIIFERMEHTSLICFSRTKVIYFADISVKCLQKQKSFLCGIGNVCHFGQSIYFPVKNGEVWKCILKSVVFNRIFSLRDIIGYSIAVYKNYNEKECFVMSLWNGQLWAISNIGEVCMQINIPQLMTRVTNLTCDLQYCFSSHDVFIIRASVLQILQQFTVEYAIKSVAINDYCAVIVSQDNRLHKYPINDNRIGGDILVTRHFSQDITAVSLFGDKITVAVGSDIQKIEE